MEFEREYLMKLARMTGKGKNGRRPYTACAGDVRNGRERHRRDRAARKDLTAVLRAYQYGTVVEIDDLPVLAQVVHVDSSRARMTIQLSPT